MKNLSVKKRLLYVILSIIIPLIIIQSSEIYVQYNKRLKSELEVNQDFAEAVSSSFINFIDDIWDTEFAVGLTLANNPSMSISDMEEYMKTIVLDQPEVERYSWLTPEGVVIASAHESKQGTDLSDRDHIARLIEGQDKTISGIIEARLDDDMILSIARGIKKDGKLLGIVTAAINVEKIGQILPNDRKSETSSFGIIDSNGMIVFRYGSPQLPYDKRRIASDSLAWHAIHGKVTKVNKIISPFDKSERLAAYVPMPEMGWASFGCESLHEMKKDTGTVYLKALLYCFLQRPLL